MKHTILALMVGLVPIAANAQTDAQLAEQVGGGFDEADKAMNAAYQKLLKILNDEGRKRLRASQRAWIAFRDAQAGFDSHHFAGGTAENIERLGSLDLLTRERTKRLLEDYRRFKDMY